LTNWRELDSATFEIGTVAKISSNKFRRQSKNVRQVTHKFVGHIEKILANVVPLSSRGCLNRHSNNLRTNKIGIEFEDF